MTQNCTDCTVRADAIVDKWNRDPDYLIEILQDIQEAYRHLPEDVMRKVADSLKVPLGRVFHIATFFKAFSLEPRGRHEIQVCVGTACHVRGAARVLDVLVLDLGVEPGETTDDGAFTLEGVRCLGCCSLAPVVSIDGEIHGGVTPDKALKLVATIRKEDANAED